MGYHIAKIKKGTIGEVSKIQEELDELKDALQQDADIMALVELSDLYGAIQAFLEHNYPDMTMIDLRIMSDITRSAFKSGDRK
jgi:hypothetical protein